jgi:hypothetical protein
MPKQELIHPELAEVHIDEDSGDISRSEVILKGALAAGAVYGVGMVAPFVRQALAMSEGGDVGILNFALTLEYLESTFYEEAKKRAKASGELKSLIGLLPTTSASTSKRSRPRSPSSAASRSPSRSSTSRTTARPGS